jgi:hypothetical protein
MLQNVTGQVVRGEDFFDRELEVSRIWRALETDNVLLLAPRRVGKSSLLHSMRASAAERGFNSVYIDVSASADELRFVQQLYRAILEHHGAAEHLWTWVKESWLGKTVSRVKKAGAAGFSIEFGSDALRWDHLGEELARALQELDAATLIQVDELPVFLLKLFENKDTGSQTRVREFLYWMRGLRQGYPHVRWMLAGSIGLDTIASRLSIADAINDLRLEPLGAFDTETAHKMLQALSDSYRIDLSKEVRERILSRVGWLLPYYLQLVFHELRSRQKPAVEDVDKTIETLLSPQHKTLFDWWRQRLREELGFPDADHASQILNTACRTPEGVRRSLFTLALSKQIADPRDREDKVRYLLDVLENDGYLVEEERRWQFRSPLLREYWRRRVAPPEAEANGDGD